MASLVERLDRHVVCPATMGETTVLLNEARDALENAEKIIDEVTDYNDCPACGRYCAHDDECPALAWLESIR